MPIEWIVAGGFLLVGVIAAIGMFLGRRDPATRPYMPTMGAPLGRTTIRPMNNQASDKKANDKKANGGSPGDGKS